MDATINHTHRLYSFWINIRNKTFNITRNLVLKRQFEELWLVEFLPLYLDRLNLEIDRTNTEGIFWLLYDKVIEFIYNSALNEHNILITIY